jgi:hypothetical protein
MKAASASAGQPAGISVGIEKRLAASKNNRWRRNGGASKLISVAAGSSAESCQPKES